jgi:hypothetical protein
LSKGFQAPDDGQQLHAVVGGQAVTAAQFLAAVAVAKDYAKAAGAGVALAGAVGVYLNVVRQEETPVC